MKWIAVANSGLAVLDQGSGPPVVFLHGFPLDHQMWDAQVAALTADYRVIVPDLRGFGSSPAHGETTTMEQFADDVNALLDGLGVVEQVTLCGLSMGGYIAFAFQRQFPQRVRALILCDTRSLPDSPEAAKQRETTAANVLQNGASVLVPTMLPRLVAASTTEQTPEVVESLRQVILKTDPRGIAAALRGMAQRRDATPDLVAFNIPTLVLVGEADAISPPAEMEALAKSLPQAQFAVIPQAGHMSPCEQPDAVNALLTGFLARVHA